MRSQGLGPWFGLSDTLDVWATECGTPEERPAAYVAESTLPTIMQRPPASTAVAGGGSEEAGAPCQPKGGRAGDGM